MNNRINIRTMAKGLTAASALTLMAMSTTMVGCEDAGDEAGDAIDDTGDAIDDAVDETGDAIDDMG